ncbi:MAG: copper oxidase [Kordia sp.]|nr:MAG: copper oxidase [Kordia sp.]
MGVTTLFQAQTRDTVRDTVYVEMAAINQPFMYNRLGAAQPTGNIFALIRDLDTAIPKDIPKSLLGKVRLRPNKRPRPIVLRANVGDVLKIKFTNLLVPYDSLAPINAYNTSKPGTVSQGLAAAFSESNLGPTASVFTKTRHAGVHILGTEMAESINDDGSFVGFNSSSLVAPGKTITYILNVPKEGVYMLYSTGATVATGGQKGGQLSNGLFGTLNVQPKGAEWYRSQVSEADLDQAITHYQEIGSITPLAKSEVPNIYNTNNIFPVIDYDATYADGTPILKMYREYPEKPNYKELIHTDLTAIITGPNRGNFTGESPSFLKVPASPNRRRPYREFAIDYHESPWTVQAFPIAYTNNKNSDGINLTGTLATGNDNFSINYGSGGIGAEIYANRIGVGPMADCNDCAYEEFFLSSWSVGDPAMVVDVPANASSNSTVNETLQNQFLLQQLPKDSIKSSYPPQLEFKAKKAIYPDDPSNVYHSYMNDHVKFRITHTGAGLTHVHHQHAHQWLHSPNSDEGHYLDSQTINPGSSYTLEMVYDGSGNLNKTVGDQIFHCHFYPHFAAGMWALWRVHDVLELGTKTDPTTGIAAANSRALPDGEIQRGTPIPGLVPIPKRAMAPVPSEIHIEDGQIVVDNNSKSPGYPFFIPGLSGSRAPHPPMDFAKGEIFDEKGIVKGTGPLDGGLPRSVIYKAKVPFENHTQYDWTKIVDSIQVIELPHDGTAVEKVAMQAHATREHNTLTPEGLVPMSSDGTREYFLLNGLPPVAGAPYADPSINLKGKAVGTKRTYKAANIQLDVVLNKKGWHYPQQRIISLWGDVNANIEGIKPPEPFYFRAQSNEYVEYWHTNLIPQYYELDDFQVRTPTDIIGQHIHLVKFDVTSSDGAANGFNYEDGTFAPDLVRERIEAINYGGKRYTYKYTQGKSIADVSNYVVNDTLLKAHAPNPIWGNAPEGQDWTGAQTTIQRWFSDPLLNNRGEDRTLRTVFTHDHFGPSTHQQIGLYAGLVIEPQNSTWFDPISGKQLSSANNGTKRSVTVDGVSRTVSDGGPTSWQANIVLNDDIDDSYREFMLEFQDTQQAYLPGSISEPMEYPEFPEEFTGTAATNFVKDANKYRGWMDPNNAIHNQKYPELISFGFRGTYSMNYRNEPLPLRVATNNSDPKDIATTGSSSSIHSSLLLKSNDSLVNAKKGNSGNLSYVYSSKIDRADEVFNTQPVGGSKIPGSDTFTFPINPLGQDMQPKDPYTPLFRAYANDKIQIRTLVGAHVTSHFFNVHGVNWLFEPSLENSGLRSTQNMSLSEHFELNFSFPVTNSTNPSTDYLYQASADASGLQAGLWGLMRAYNTKQSDLLPLPNNNIDENPIANLPKNCGCPTGSDVPKKTFYVTAFSIDQLGGNLIYNEKYGNMEDDAIVFIGSEENLKKEDMIALWKGEPLVLRANAGDCITVQLTNAITKNFETSQGKYDYQSAKKYGDIVYLTASSDIGLHAELLSYDVSKYDGANIGLNQVQTVKIDSTRTYEWYAGKWENNKPVPVEFGSVVLSSSDPLEQYVKGLFGALIIEPQGATWKVDENLNQSANIYDENNTLLFREFVFQFQDNIIADTTESTDNVSNATVNYAINYKSEPLANLLNNPSLNLNQNDIANINSITANGVAYPETPHFIAKAGMPLRLRLLHPGGLGGGETFTLHGHSWQEEPYQYNSTVMGHNEESQQFGFRDQLGPLNSFDLLIDSAGGKNAVEGDYLYNDMVNLGFQGGVWGVMTVNKGHSQITISDIKINTISQLEWLITIQGKASVNPVTGKLPKAIVLEGDDRAIVVNKDGTWTIYELAMIINKQTEGLTLTTTDGGYVNISQEQIRKISEASSSKNSTKTVKRKTPVRTISDGTKPQRVEGKKVKMN